MLVLRARRRGAMLCAAIGLVVAVGSGCSSSTPGVAAPSGSATPPAGSGTPGVSPGGLPPSVGPTAPPKTGTVYLASVELQPEDPYPGGQLAVLINGGSQPVDPRCWTVHSAGTGVSARILTEHAIAPGAYLRLLPESVVFDSVDTLSLLDNAGRVMDQTPQLTDRARDDQVWLRQPSGTWTFGRGFQLPPQGGDGRLVVGPAPC